MYLEERKMSFSGNKTLKKLSIPIGVARQGLHLRYLLTTMAIAIWTRISFTIYTQTFAFSRGLFFFLLSMRVFITVSFRCHSSPRHSGASLIAVRVRNTRCLARLCNIFTAALPKVAIMSGSVAEWKDLDFEIRHSIFASPLAKIYFSSH